MADLSVSELIAAPTPRVYALATDLARAAEHIDGIDKIELLSEGPFGPGTKWRETRTMMGKSATEVLEITAAAAPESPADAGSYTAECESCGAHYWSTFTFTPEGEGTRVTMSWRWKTVSLMARLMSPLSVLMMGSVKKMIAQDLADLKRVAEAADESL